MSAILEKEDGLLIRKDALLYQFQQCVGSHSLISMELSAKEELRQVRVIPVKTLVLESQQPVVTGTVYSIRWSS